MNEAQFYEHQAKTRSVANIQFDYTRTHRELESAGIFALDLDDDLLALCIEAMRARDPDLDRGRIHSEGAILFAKARDGLRLDG
jgi:hypothetical protein